MSILSTSQAQVKIGSNPTSIDTKANLQIEAGNGVNMVISKDSGNVGIGTIAPNINAQLEIKSDNKGLLLSRVALLSTTNPAPMTVHVMGMVVYNTSTVADVSPGFYSNDGTKWSKLVATSGFVPMIVAAGSLTSSYFYDDGAGFTKCRLGTANSNDGNYNTTTFEYTVPSVGTYNLALTMGYVLNNNNGNNSHTIFATHASANGTRIKTVALSAIRNFSYVGSQSENVFMAGSAVFRPAVGDKLYFEAQPCNGCVGRYTISSLEGTFQKISN